MANLYYNFREGELHIHYDEDSIVASDSSSAPASVNFTYFLAGELNSLNRKSSDTMANSLSRFLLNLKKKKIVKSGSDSATIKGKKQKKPKQAETTYGPADTPNTSSGTTVAAPVASAIEIVVINEDGLIVDAEVHSNMDWRSGMLVVVGCAAGEAASSNRVGMCHERYFDGVHLNLAVVLNPPLIQNIRTFPNQLINGCPVVCGINVPTASSAAPWYMKNALSEPEQVECDYAWFMSCTEAHCVVEGDYKFTGCQLAHFSPQVPSGDGVYKLKVYCTPKRRSADGYVYGRSVAHYIHSSIQTESLLAALPTGMGLRPMAETAMSGDKVYNRAASCSSAGAMVRVMSYNILSDCYCGKLFCNGRYDYLADQHIDFNYRCQLVLHEISEVYKFPDIIALQEMDAKVFHQYFRPLCDVQQPGSSDSGADPQHPCYSHYTNKSGSTNEGCAFLLNANVFDLLAFVDLNLSKCIEELPEIQALLAARPDVHDILVNRVTTIAQIAVCAIKSEDVEAPSKVVIVANTHLFFHPVAEYVRLLQMYVITGQVERIRQQLLARTFVSCADVGEGVKVHLSTFAADWCPTGEGEPTISCIYTGDFNSTSETPTVEFILKGEILSDHHVWNSLHDFSWGRGGAAATAASASASRTNSPIPAGEAASGSPKAVKAKAYVNPADHSQYHKLQVAQSVKEVDISACIPARLAHPHGNSCSAGSISGHNNGWDARTDSTLGSSGYGLVSTTGFPLFTNYTVDFKDCLDYIFVAVEEFAVVQRNAIPTDSELYLEAEGAPGAAVAGGVRVPSIPSQHHPSDHLPLVVDLVFR